MHVEVTKMRHQGVKLLESHRAQPMIGFARVSYWRLKNGREDRLVRSITLRAVDDDVAASIAEMNDAELKELRGDYMLFIGEEMAGNVKHKQSWLVRPLTDGEKKSIKRRELGLEP